MRNSGRVDCYQTSAGDHGDPFIESAAVVSLAENAHWMTLKKCVFFSVLLGGKRRLTLPFFDVITKVMLSPWQSSSRKRPTMFQPLPFIFSPKLLYIVFVCSPPILSWCYSLSCSNTYLHPSRFYTSSFIIILSLSVVHSRYLCTCCIAPRLWQ